MALLFVLWFSCALWQYSVAFIPYGSRINIAKNQRSLDDDSAGPRNLLWMSPEDGRPPMEEDNIQDGEKENGTLSAEHKHRFLKLMESILEAKDPEHIPSLLAKNLDFLLTLTHSEGQALANCIVDDARSEGEDRKAIQLEQAIELSFSFMEDFVYQASKIDLKNKEFLGRILRIVSDQDSSAHSREEILDRLFATERDQLTAGFLRHVENECERIANAPKMTPESARLLEMLRVIQARVVEELGEDLGEAAQVLGQLIGYDTTTERLAVLEAGLTVRGVGFAHELKQLTEEALEGFDKVSGKADPDLVKIVEELDNNLVEYLGDNSKFQ